MKRIGLTTGKFFPMHLGHEGLIEFGAGMLDELIVLVSSPVQLIVDHPSDDNLVVKGTTLVSYLYDRTEIIRKKYANNPKIKVVYIADVIGEPAAYDQHGTAIDEEFWRKWLDVFRLVAPQATHFVSSDRYGKEAAKRLGLEWLPFDPDRELVDISATRIRNDPLKHWKYISKEFRNWYGRVVTVVGAESSGKSTLAKDVAREWGSPYVPEYGRIITEAVGDGKWTKDHFAAIVAGQRRMVDHAVRNSDNGLVICDTDIWTTALYAHEYLGSNVEEYYYEHREDGFEGSHIVAVPPNIPWVQDGKRIMPNQDDREKFFWKSTDLYRAADVLLITATDRHARVAQVNEYIYNHVLGHTTISPQVNLRTDQCKNQVLHAQQT